MCVAHSVSSKQLAQIDPSGMIQHQHTHTLSKQEGIHRDVCIKHTCTHTQTVYYVCATLCCVNQALCI